MKKFICVLLTALLLLSLGSCDKGEEEGESSQVESYPETPGEDFQYTELEDGSGISVEYYYGGDEVVVIPAEIDGKAVKDVRISSFRYNEKIKALYIPEGVTKLSVLMMSIDQTATTTLEKIVLPSSLRVIDNSAFKGFAYLKEINLPDNLTKVGGGIFEGCVELKSTYLPAACFGNGYASLQSSCFESIVVPEGVTKLDYTEFSNAALKNITLPSTLKEIGYAAFYNCQITEITLPEGLEIIDERAFHGTKLREVVIPKSVKTMSEMSFSGIDTLERVVFLGDAPEGFIKFEDNYDVPSKLYEIHISKSARGFSFPRWNGFPVRYTDSDEKPSISGDFEYFKTENGVTVSAYLGNDREPTIPETIDGIPVKEIGMRAFMRNETLKSVTLPSGIEVIGIGGFSACSTLESVSFNEGLREIGHSAFSMCDALSEVVLPNGVETISNEAFALNDGLVKVVIGEGVKNWGSGIFQNNKSLSDVTLPADMKIIPDGMFFANYALTEITLPAGIEVIGRSAFRSTKIESMVLPEGVRVIDGYAFEGTSKLASITIPETLEYIGEEAFESTSITEITLPAGFKTFWGWSFNCCYKLQRITFMGNAPEVMVSVDEDEYGFGYTIDYSFPNNTEFVVYINEGATGFEGGFWDECEDIIVIGSEEDTPTDKDGDW